MTGGDSWSRRHLMMNSYAGVFGQDRDQRVVVVVVIVVNVLDAARRQRPKAVNTRIMRDVNGGVLQAGTPARAVAHRVDFTVNDGLLMVVAHAADVRGTGDKAVVAHGNNTMVPDNDGTYT